MRAPPSSDSPASGHPRLAAAGLLLGVWSVPVLLATGAMYRVLYEDGLRVSLSRIALYQGLVWYPWVLLSPVVAVLGRRFPIQRGKRLRSLSAHFGCGAAMALGLTLLVAAMELLTTAGPEADLATIGRTVARFLPLGLVVHSAVYWTVLGVSLALGHYQRLRRRELDASQLEALLAQAQLQALRAQLHPHFLFNTLHSISSLMDEDVAAARRMIARLSDLLRASLQSAGAQQVSLADELALLDLYLNIERVRFQDRLDVKMEIEPEALASRVPSLLLQPLVENAIRHGIAPRSDSGRLEIAARRAGSELQLEIRDDGPGLATGVPREGLGLGITRQRLRRLYDDGFRLELANRRGGGCEVRLALPFEPAPEPAT